LLATIAIQFLKKKTLSALKTPLTMAGLAGNTIIYKSIRQVALLA